MNNLAKPSYGSPCNQCGFCCATELCTIAVKAFPGRTAPCPALQSNGKGATVCGIVANPERYIPDNVKHYSSELVSAAMLVVIGSGVGCDTRVDEEPENLVFETRLKSYRILNAAVYSMAWDVVFPIEISPPDSPADKGGAPTVGFPRFIASILSTLDRRPGKRAVVYGNDERVKLVTEMPTTAKGYKSPIEIGTRGNVDAVHVAEDESRLYAIRFDTGPVVWLAAEHLEAE